MNELLESLASGLAAAGVRHCFGITGSGPTWRLLSSLEARGVRYHRAAHEGAAAMMAGGVIQASGLPSASLSIKGPGVANLASGVAYNHFEGIPSLSISEAYGLGTAPGRMHKRMDHARLLGGITRAVWGLPRAAAGVGDLLSTARQEVPGPVHVELAETAPEVGGVDGIEPPTRPEVRWEFLAERVRRARRPALVVGSLARRRAWGSRLASLQIPVFTTAGGRGVLDERLPQAAGVFTGDGKQLAPETWLLEQADLVIGLGLRNLEVTSAHPFRCASVLLDEASGPHAEGFAAEAWVPGAPPAAFEASLDALSEFQWGLDDLQSGLRAMRDELISAGWLPARCFAVLDALAEPHALVLDTGSFCTIAEHIWRCGPRRPLAGSNNGRFMGGGIPVATGFALGAPGVPVFCAVGDGGLRMHSGELALAVERKLPLCVVYCCDGRYGSIVAGAVGAGLFSGAVTIADPSWCRIAEAMGCEADRVSSEGELESALRAWGRNGPRFIEAVFEPELYAVMTRRLR